MATIPTLADFRTAFPELSEIVDAKVEASIGAASELVDSSSRTLLYASAHCAVMLDSEGGTEPDGGSGVVTLEIQGPQQVQYLVADEQKKGAAFWGPTVYGRFVMEMRAMSPNKRLPQVF